MRLTDKKHLAFIRTLPCIVTGDDVTVEAAHIRYADASIDKPITGKGIKPDDCFVIPLSLIEHRRQHSMGEREYWRHVGINPIIYALALFAYSGDHVKGCRIVRAARAVNILMAG